VLFRGGDPVVDRAAACAVPLSKTCVRSSTNEAVSVEEAGTFVATSLAPDDDDAAAVPPPSLLALLLLSI